MRINCSTAARQGSPRTDFENTGNVLVERQKNQPAFVTKRVVQILEAIIVDECTASRQLTFQLMRYTCLSATALSESSRLTGLDF